MKNDHIMLFKEKPFVFIWQLNFFVKSSILPGYPLSPYAKWGGTVNVLVSPLHIPGTPLSYP